MEVEAKFSIPDRATFDELCRLEALAGYRLAQGGVKQVHDRYLDSGDRAILRAGYACRVRRKGQKYVATLKGLGGADADSGIHHRTEHEVPVNDDDPTTWPDSSARDLALQLSNGRPLHELFSLRQERHVRLLYADEPAGTRRVAELSLDIVIPAACAAREALLYFELEIELLDQGNESDLHALSGNIQTVWSLRPESRSKFERGLELADRGK
jgi:inorganic triphosphatase YgiF